MAKFSFENKFQGFEELVTQIIICSKFFMIEFSIMRTSKKWCCWCAMVLLKEKARFYYLIIHSYAKKNNSINISNFYPVSNCKRIKIFSEYWFWFLYYFWCGSHIKKEFIHAWRNWLKYRGVDKGQIATS